jgi:hypothetical protein
VLVTETDASLAMSRTLSEIVELARHYCALIESTAAGSPSWLGEVAELLPRLHAGISSLDGLRCGAEVSLSPDLDARFEIFTRLREVLGERDPYWMEFDRVGDCHAMTGSLADDLTDIYCELRHGLDLIDEEPARAVQDWLTGFDNHWGQHLVDAQRHLSVLASQDRLG